MVLIIALTTVSWLLNPPLFAGEIVFVLLQIHIFCEKNHPLCCSNHQVDPFSIVKNDVTSIKIALKVEKSIKIR